MQRDGDTASVASLTAAKEAIEATATTTIATLIALLLTVAAVTAPYVFARRPILVGCLHGLCAVAAAFVAIAAAKRWRAFWLGATVVGTLQMASSLAVTTLAVIWLLSGHPLHHRAGAGLGAALHSPIFVLSGLLLALGISAAWQRHCMGRSLSDSPLTEVERAISVLIKAHRCAWWPPLDVRGATMSNATHETRHYGDLIHFTVCLTRSKQQAQQRRSSIEDDVCRSSRRACFTASQNLGHSPPTSVSSSLLDVWRVMRGAVVTAVPEPQPKSQLVTPLPAAERPASSSVSSGMPAFMSRRSRRFSSHFQTEMGSVRDDDQGSDMEFDAQDVASVPRGGATTSVRRPSMCFSAPHRPSHGQLALSISSSVSSSSNNADGEAGPEPPTSFVRSSTARFNVSHFQVQQDRGSRGPPSRRRSVSLSPTHRSDVWGLLLPGGNSPSSTHTTSSLNNESTPSAIFGESPCNRRHFVPTPVPRIAIDAARAMRTAALDSHSEEGDNTGKSSRVRWASHRSTECKKNSRASARSGMGAPQKTRSVSSGPHLPGALWMHSSEPWLQSSSSPVTVPVAPFRAAEVPWALRKRADGPQVQVKSVQQMSSKYNRLMRPLAQGGTRVGLDAGQHRREAPPSSLGGESHQGSSTN